MSRCLIGTALDGITAAPNSTGIRLINNTDFALIGGFSPEDGNVIAGNTNTGVVVSTADCEGNQIRFNRFTGNGLRGIAVAIGANGGVDQPTVTTFSSLGASGTFPPGGTVDLYYQDVVTNGAQGAEFIESVFDSGGNWEYTGALDLSRDLAVHATDFSDNTTEFVIAAPTVTPMTYPVTTALDENDGIGASTAPPCATRLPPPMRTPASTPSSSPTARAAPSISTSRRPSRWSTARSLSPKVSSSSDPAPTSSLSTATKAPGSLPSPLAGSVPLSPASRSPAASMRWGAESRTTPTRS